MPLHKCSAASRTTPEAYCWLFLGHPLSFTMSNYPSNPEGSQYDEGRVSDPSVTTACAAEMTDEHHSAFPFTEVAAGIHQSPLRRRSHHQVWLSAEGAIISPSKTLQMRPDTNSLVVDHPTRGKSATNGTYAASAKTWRFLCSTMSSNMNTMSTYPHW